MQIDKNGVVATTADLKQESVVTSEMALKSVEAIIQGRSYKVLDQDVTINGTTYFKLVSSTGTDFYVDKTTAEVKIMNKYDLLQNYEDAKKSMTGYVINVSSAEALVALKEASIQIEPNAIVGTPVVKDDGTYYPITVPYSVEVTNDRKNSGVDELLYFVNVKNGTIGIEFNGKFMQYSDYISLKTAKKDATVAEVTDKTKTATYTYT